MITESQIYWITRLDNIRLFFGLVGSLAWLGMAVAAFIYFEAWDTSQEAKPFYYMRRCIIACFVTLIVWSAMLVFVPSTKEMALIKIIPRIANSDMVQKEMPELYQLAKQALKEQIKDKERPHGK